MIPVRVSAFVEVRRGHLRWTDFRYQEALLDFEDAASLEDYGGAKSINSWGKKKSEGEFFLGISPS